MLMTLPLTLLQAGAFLGKRVRGTLAITRNTWLRRIRCCNLRKAAFHAALFSGEAGTSIYVVVKTVGLEVFSKATTPVVFMLRHTFLTSGLRDSKPRSLRQPLSHILLAWAWGSGAARVVRNPQPAKMRSGAPSQSRECAPDLPMHIHYGSGCRTPGVGRLTSNTHRPETNDLGTWTTIPSDNPMCRQV